MDELKIFKNDEFGEIRSLIINSEPWFIGKDVVTALGYSNYRKAIIDHVDEEDKGVTKCDTLGGKQNLTIINESALYSLILSSKLSNAKKFKRWVTNEVLPTIRKTGGYVSDEKQFVESYFPNADEPLKNFMISTLSEVKRQNIIINNQKKEIEHKEDIIIGLVDNITVADKRQILNRVVRKGGKYQERWGALYREFENKYHINVQVRMDNYNEDHKPKIKNKLDYVDKVMNKVPDLYEIACKLYENDVKKLVQEMYELNNIS